ncbi:hypothetical protein D9619_011863 [Psilocybe cf. subviscida]|uniref:NACHT domain-containing protein n=1 Tax=Psilocybe cf. subviscida TaxID=2480587 RepID=A0A8H5B067_9AGAR|nr:hypothetical protein D9619_011863 [Psilocybe cf. subviscida]
MHNRVSMFKKPRNIDIKNSSFTVNVDSPKSGNIDRLLEEVSLNAILNAGGRADEVRCYPGTREDVIRKIERWMDGPDEPHHRMLWLSGATGAGKSAIAQTVAERCQKRGLQAANFFFFRDDGTRNHAQPLVATLVYQMLDFYPALHSCLTEYLTAKPLAYKASAEEQFKQLISSPIHMVHKSSPIHRPIILIIDGLDECDNRRQQELILRALLALVEESNIPVRVLVASRAEHHLAMFFNKLGNSAESIFLDADYRPQDDIRHFITAKFNEIKKVHSLAHTLGENWPAEADIDAIANKSSGQFIYAATVMRFIEYSTASPALSLLRVHVYALKERESAVHRVLDGGPAELTRKIEYLTAAASDDWTLVLEVCDRASTSKSNAKEAVRTLRRKFKYGEPSAQIYAAHLWAIMLRNSSDAFASQSTSRKFLGTLEDLIQSSRTSAVVRGHLLEVIAAAAYASGAKKDPKENRVGFKGLWQRVKPFDAPNEGVPLYKDDTMFNLPCAHNVPLMSGQIRNKYV